MAKPQEYLREIAPRIDSIYRGALTDAAERLDALESTANALLHQIDIGDFVDSNGHSAKLLKPVWDMMKIMGRAPAPSAAGAEPACTSDEWLANCPQSVRDLADKIKAGAAPVPRMTGAALASQEPVAEVLLVDGEKVIDASMAFFDSVELGTKLYRAAGAAPVQQEPEPIQVCRLMKKEEGIWVAASEFYAGHPDQKWVKLVSTNPGSWSIQRRVTGKQIADGLAKALAGTPPALEVTECQWSFEDDDSGTWRSSCGELWSFIDGGPNENRVTYCHHCGGKVSNAAAAPAAKVPEEPRIDINDLSGMIAAVIKEQP